MNGGKETEESTIFKEQSKNQGSTIFKEEEEEGNIPMGRATRTTTANPRCATKTTTANTRH